MENWPVSSSTVAAGAVSAARGPATPWSSRGR